MLSGLPEWPTQKHWRITSASSCAAINGFSWQKSCSKSARAANPTDDGGKAEKSWMLSEPATASTIRSMTSASARRSYNEDKIHRLELDAGEGMCHGAEGRSTLCRRRRGARRVGLPPFLGTLGKWPCSRGRPAGVRCLGVQTAAGCTRGHEGYS